MGLSLYSYFRSSAAWRVRIALAIKGLQFDTVPVHLIRDGGQQHARQYAALNPQELVPALQDDDRVLTQSLAILEYLDDKFPEPRLLPADTWERAKARSLALQIACDIHPINNLRVLQYLKSVHHASQDQADAWVGHWIATGFAAIEAQLAQANASNYCVGDGVTFADICLVPQVFNARRFGLNMHAYPFIQRIDAHLLTLPAFSETHPSKQPDAE